MQLVPGFLTSGEAGRRLGVTKPTVRALLERGKLRGVRQPHGSRSYWQVEEESIAELLAIGGPSHRRTRRPSRLDRVEAELEVLRQTMASVSARETASGKVPSSAARERDELRVRVVNLEEALARMATASELQREADAARATVVEQLLAALTASEQADALRRRAVENLEEALATFRRPGRVDERA